MTILLASHGLEDHLGEGLPPKREFFSIGLDDLKVLLIGIGIFLKRHQKTGQT